LRLRRLMRKRMRDSSYGRPTGARRLRDGGAMELDGAKPAAWNIAYAEPLRSEPLQFSGEA